MNISKSFYFYMVILTSLAGCSAIPQPQSYQLSFQQKMETASHWEVLANNIANQVNAELIAQGYLNHAVYVKHRCGQVNPCDGTGTSSFDEGFNDLLTSQLVAFGVPTLAQPEEGGLSLEYKVQVVYHDKPRINALWPGELTMLALGIIVLQDAPWEIQTLVSTAAADISRQGQVVNGNYEVIVSVSIIDVNRYLMRKSSIFYINNPDFWHYHYPGQAAEIELTATRPSSSDGFEIQPTPKAEHAGTAPYHYLPVFPLRVQ